MRFDDNNYDALEQAYMELGKEYYEGAFEDPLPQLLPLFDKITKIKNEKGRRNTVSEKRCPRCGNLLEDGEVYCGNCGERIY